MEIKKILGQSNPSATTGTIVYTVPDAKGAVISSIVVCNQAATAGTFRVYVTYAANSPASKDYLYYDVAIAANDTFTAVIGITLSNADYINVYCSSVNFSFNIFGAEFDQTNVYAP